MASGVTSTASDLSKTDYARWRLKAGDGRQTWRYLSEEETVSWPQTIADKHHLGLPTVCYISRNHSSVFCRRPESKHFNLPRASPTIPLPALR